MNAAPKAVVDARNAYLEVKRRHGLCQRITCYRKAVKDRACCEVCLKRTAATSRRWGRERRAVDAQGEEHE